LKLVLLPGMDGTGELFKEFVTYYDAKYVIISFPNDGSQSYEELSKYVLSKLPEENHIILAESFSGGLVPQLLKSENKHIKGVIFVASFLSCPRPFLVRLARLLPVKSLAKLPGANYLHKMLFLGWSVSRNTISKFKSVINSLPASTLSNRLNSIQRLSAQNLPTYTLPCFYLRPSNDLLVPKSKVSEIRGIFKNFSIRSVSGSHFILQSSPEASVSEVEQVVQHITKYSS